MVADTRAARAVLHRAAGRSAAASSRPRSIAPSSSSRSRWAARTRASCSTTARCARRCTRSSSAATCRPGQRCTGTERVLVHRKIADRFIDALAQRARASSGSATPTTPSVFAGPLVDAAALAKLEAAIEAREARPAPRRSCRARAAGRLVPHGVAAPAARRRAPRRRLHRRRGVRSGSLRRGDRQRRRGDRGARRRRRTASRTRCSPARRARFEAFYARTRSGILNRNRSTNLASPKLPFGGVGQSGNYRPAGAWAHRNVIAPVAVLENVARRGHAAPACSRRSCRAFDLDRLEAQHAARRRPRRRARSSICRGRCTSRARRAAGCPRARRCSRACTPAIACRKEKKPPVFDHLRSAGPWMVSIDDEPLARARRHEPDRDRRRRLRRGSGRARVHRGRVRRHARRATTTPRSRETWAAAEYANTLRQLVPGLPHVTFVASRRRGEREGDGAVPDQLPAQGRDEGPRVRRQLPRPHAARAARDALAEQARAVRARRATSASSRRSRCGRTPTGDEPPAPSGFYAAAATGDIAELRERFGDAKDDRAARGRGRVARRGRTTRSRPASTSA